MLKMVDGTGIIGVDMICPLGVSTPQPPNYDRVELEGAGMLVLPNSLDAPLERLELGGKTEGKKQVIPVGEIEQGTVTAHAGNNYPSDYRVRTKSYINLTSGVYEVMCTGAKLGNVIFYSAENKYEKMLSETHIPLPIKFTLEENKTVRILFSNSESTPIAPTDIKNAILEADVSPEHPQEIVNSGKWNEGTQKYEVDVKVTGKNLFDKRLLEGGEIVEFNGVECYKYIDNNHNFKYKRKFENGQQYAFTLRILRPASKESNATDMAIVYTDGSIKQMRFRHGELKTFVSDNGKTIDYFSGGYNFSTDCYLDLIVTRLSVGGQDTGYEPYKEQTLTLALDQPLRGIGEMKDELSESGILRRVKSIALNGSEKWYKYENSAFVAMNCYGLKIDDLEARNYSLTTLCNFFKWARFPQDIESQTAHGGYIYFTVPKETYPDLESFKGWLAKNTPVLEYRLKEPALEELSEEDKASIRALKTYYPTTVITVDGGELDPDIKVTYRKEI